MVNKLKTDITGKVVIISNEILDGGITERMFLAQGGDGATRNAEGSIIQGMYLDDYDVPGELNGQWIAAIATNEELWEAQKELEILLPDSVWEIHDDDKKAGSRP